MSCGEKPSKAKRISEYKSYDKLTENFKKKFVDYILSFENKKENNWFLLMGQTEASKGHLAIGIGVTLFKEKHKKVIYIPYT